jgi:rhodanese-related sulfurtransferase
VSHSPAFLALVNGTRERVKEVTIEQAQARMAAGARLIDVREQSEWAAGHMVGAEYLGKGVIERDIEVRVPDKSTELILSCGGGFRSVLAAEALQHMGYTNVASMMGGWREWVEKGLPTTTE